MNQSTPRSADVLVTKIATNPTNLADLQKDPLGTLTKLAAETTKEVPPAYLTDVWVYRGVVIALGLVVVTAVIGAIVLSLNGKPSTPEVITALGAAAIGALAGLLAPSPVK